MNDQLLERDVESFLIKECKGEKILCVKLSVIGRRGWPDRLLIAHGPIIKLVELKRPIGKTKKMQDYIHKILKEYGVDVCVAYTKKQAKEIVREICTARLSKEGD